MYNGLQPFVSCVFELPMLWQLQQNQCYLTGSFARSWFLFPFFLYVSIPLRVCAVHYSLFTIHIVYAFWALCNALSNVKMPMTFQLKHFSLAFHVWFFNILQKVKHNSKCMIRLFHLWQSTRNRSRATHHMLSILLCNGHWSSWFISRLFYFSRHWHRHNFDMEITWWMINGTLWLPIRGKRLQWICTS